jgi:hypothetical protein
MPDAWSSWRRSIFSWDSLLVVCLMAHHAWCWRLRLEHGVTLTITMRSSDNSTPTGGGLLSCNMFNGLRLLNLLQWQLTLIDNIIIMLDTVGQSAPESGYRSAMGRRSSKPATGAGKPMS